MFAAKSRRRKGKITPQKSFPSATRPGSVMVNQKQVGSHLLHPSPSLRSVLLAFCCACTTRLDAALPPLTRGCALTAARPAGLNSIADGNEIIRDLYQSS